MEEMHEENLSDTNGRALLSELCGRATNAGCGPGSGARSSCGSINGAGATFPNPIYSKWFSEYHKKFPDIQINYQPAGSGAGIRQVSEGTVDFGATDGPMTDEQLKQAKTKILHFPTV